MALKITRDKRSEHKQFGIAGDATSTFITVQSNHDNTETAEVTYIRDGGSLITDTPNTSGWFIKIWEWTADSGGHPLGTAPVIDQQGVTAGDMAMYVGAIANGNYNNCVFAIGNKDHLNSNQGLHDAMAETLSSGIYSKMVGTGTSNVDNSYACIGYYNVNSASARILCEDFQRAGSFTHAYTQFHPETTDINRIGYVGYVRDLLMGRGHRATPQSGAGQAFTYTIDPNPTASQLMFTKCEQNEYLRLTATARVSRDTIMMNSYMKFGIEEFDSSGNSLGTASHLCKDMQWTNIELYYQVASASAASIVVSVNVGAGQNNCVSSGYSPYGIFQNLEVYKCGFTAPTQSEELRVTAHTMTAGKLVTSPGHWDPMIPSDYGHTTFGTSPSTTWENAKIQNLHTGQTHKPDDIIPANPSYVGMFSNVANSQSWTTANSQSWTTQFGSGDTSVLGPWKQNGTCTDTGFKIGTPHGNTYWQGGNVQNTPADGWAREHRNYATDTIVQDYQIGDRLNSINDGPGGLGSATGATYGNKVRVDDSKYYLLGWWIYVGDWTANTLNSPNRISMIARGFEGGTPQVGNTDGFDATPIQLLDVNGNGVPDNQFASMTVSAKEYNTYQSGSQLDQWKFYYAMFLPYDLTSTEVLKWKTNYWGRYFGLKEPGEGNTDFQESGNAGVSGEMMALRQGYVAQMPEGTTYIAAHPRIEWHGNTDGIIKGSYPVAMEIDPMNFNDRGNLIAWDFDIT